MLRQRLMISQHWGQDPPGLYQCPLDLEVSLSGWWEENRHCSNCVWAQSTGISSFSVFFFSWPLGSFLTYTPWAVSSWTLEGEPLLVFELLSLCRTCFSCTLHFEHPHPNAGSQGFSWAGACKAYLISFSSRRVCGSLLCDIWCLEDHCSIHFVPFWLFQQESKCSPCYSILAGTWTVSLFPSLPSSLPLSLSLPFFYSGEIHIT